MQLQKLSADRNVSRSTLTLAFAIVVLVLSIAAQAQTETVIYNFPSTGKAPHTPYAGLVFDSAGNLYGTTYLGGAHNFGTVFKLTPVSGGGWSETTIHSFSGTSDGGNPVAPLVIDSAGNLYGTTFDGGSSGQGTVFELSPTSGGGWRDTTLHSFSNGTDGYNPSGGLVFDRAGNLYGNTGLTLFKLTHTSGGGWHYAVVHEFSSNTGGGEGTLIFDAAGNLYGTGGGGNTTCGQFGCGVVYKLSPTTGGAWHESILLTFNGANGEFPLAGLIFDAAGNLYGTTSEGGNLTDCSPPNGAGCGVVFKLSPETGGGWHESVLYKFTGGTDGAHPAASLALDASGNVYGTTEQGGDLSGSCDPGPGCGVAFELSPSGSSWSESVLHTFTGGTDGGLPAADLIFDSSGNLYSTTAIGGASGEGTVFEITP